MWEAVRFLFFSSVESYAAFSLMLSIFRLKPLEFVWPALFSFLIMNLISFFLREQLSLSFMVPAISTIIFILLITIVVRVPILWAAIIAMTGMFLYTTFQAIVILSLFGSFSKDMQYSSAGTVVQIVTSSWIFFFVWILLKFKIGFTAEFERLRFKWEHIVVVLIIIIGLVASSTVMYYNNLLFIILVLALLAGLLLYYAVIKEREEFADD
ncbi:hypothetical protein [Paenibacillus sp. 23TSA30-6]|uniref:hypothetical protein n=1 Tax=Paenibacillus sp. 23TSA30-6 TaxID=2546104 RepID=UPI001787B36E|nr:hypothetical protein [Paenibacillus sp. 23TSA30-6]MBE0335134.1 hypothetical protein [Paenibacillus sp. 23TSA30-6]